MGVAAAVVAVVAAAGSAQQQRQAAKKQEKARKGQQRQAEFRAARAKRKEVRQARVLRADILNQAVQTGTGTTSSVAGGVAGVQTRAASNIANVGFETSLSGNISSNLQKAADFRGNAAALQTVSSTATVFAGSKGFEDLGSSIFD